MSKATAVLASILGVILLIAIAVGGYLGGWWLKEDSVNRTQNIRRGSFEYQETRRDEIIRQASFEDGNVTLVGEPSFDFSEGQE